ncbi:hypothetical protein [Desulfobacterium sp. N47]|uniref:Uncharacterized protein n=1 Tax=uncultured Desulfobacterium sp. TaxID=201089 RepID=E1YCU6_9BACT|nr:hypothetical protein N47_G37140 [uncultured Desulfobacterium sp.]
MNKDTPFEAKKVIEINFVGSPHSPVKRHLLDTFDDANLPNWDKDTQIGTHEVSPDNALHVKTSASAFGSGTWGFLQLNTDSGAVNIDLTSAWKNAGYCLAYDLQVKISNSEPLYMAGLTFKVAGSGDDREFYGISYLKTKQRKLGVLGPWEQADGIPSGVVPDNVFMDPPIWEGSWPILYQVQYSKPAIVLWKRYLDTNTGVYAFTWLAYKLLASTDFIVGESGNLIPWSNLQIRLIEAYPLNFTTAGTSNTSPLLSGAIVVGPNGSARISGTPVITSGSWASSNVIGILTLTNISGTFSSGENLKVNGTVLAKASGTLGGKSNFIRAYYGDANATNPDTSDIIPNIPTDNNRKRSLRTEIHWPVDNVSDWKAENDYMTLVQWDGVQAPALRLGGSGGDAKEGRAIIEDGSLLTPDSGVIDYSGIALHATGSSADSTYFDDFAVQY